MMNRKLSQDTTDLKADAQRQHKSTSATMGNTQEFLNPISMSLCPLYFFHWYYSKSTSPTIQLLLKIKTWTSRPELDDFDIDAGSPALEKGLADCSWKHIKELCRAKICLWSPSISLPVKRKCYHVCRIQTATAWVLGNPRVGHAGVNVDISKRKSNPVGQFTSLDIDAPEGGGGKIDPHSRAQRW